MPSQIPKRRIWLSPSQREEAVSRYVAGETPKAIGDSFGVCANNIVSAARKAGAVIRDRSVGRRKYTHKEDVFDEITPDAAYWIGFLFADGSLPKKTVGSPTLSVGLQAADRGHLEKLLAFMGSNHQIYDTVAKIRGKTFPGVRITIAAPRIAEALQRHGMGVKSLERVAPHYLINSRDFWRGLVDGDGHVGSSKRVRESGNEGTALRFELCGGLTLVEQFLTYLKQFDIGLGTTIMKQGKIYRARMGGDTALRGMRLLYGDAPLALERKKIFVNSLLNPSTHQFSETP